MALLSCGSHPVAETLASSLETSSLVLCYISPEGYVHDIGLGRIGVKTWFLDQEDGKPQYNTIKAKESGPDNCGREGDEDE